MMCYRFCHQCNLIQDYLQPALKDRLKLILNCIKGVTMVDAFDFSVLIKRRSEHSIQQKRLNSTDTNMENLVAECNSEVQLSCTQEVVFGFAQLSSDMDSHNIELCALFKPIEEVGYLSWKEHRNNWDLCPSCKCITCKAQTGIMSELESQS